MRIIDVASFRGAQAWEALAVEDLEQATVRLHWTDAPYHWHVNDGPEVFVVLDGDVDMSVRRAGHVEVYHLRPGLIFHALEGDEHLATPRGEARILVVERSGSD